MATSLLVFHASPWKRGDHGHLVPPPEYALEAETYRPLHGNTYICKINIFSFSDFRILEIFPFYILTDFFLALSKPSAKGSLSGWTTNQGGGPTNIKKMTF